MLGFKKFPNARRVIAGVELMHKIQKGQFDTPAARGLHLSQRKVA
jgi:hypothetical protein